jgi:hypothetical protein
MDQETSPYWLLTWLESRRVRASADAAVLLSKRSVLHELRETAEQWSKSPTVQPGINLVAGTGLRLDDDLTCPTPSCRRRYIDVLFRHAWHYFDRILLPDGVGELLLSPPPGWTEAYTREALLNLIDVVMYLDRLGAASLVSYYPRIPTNSQVLDRILSGDKETRWYEAWSEVESTLKAQARFRIAQLGNGRVRVRGSDPFLQVSNVGEYRAPKGHTRSEMVEEFIHDWLHRHIYELESDLQAAQHLKGALGSSVWTHEKVLSKMSAGPDATNVLFRLSFPSLQNVPISELISLRTHEGDAFLMFRQSLTKAAEEILKKNKGLDTDSVAGEVLRDYIEPELARLRSKLKAAQRTMAKRAVFSIAIAGMSTLCGLQLGLDPIASGAAGLLLSGAADAASKYVGEKQAIEMSDMFFLWKALQHASDRDPSVLRTPRRRRSAMLE